MAADIKMTLQSWAKVDSCNKDEFNFTMNGFNSKGNNVQVQIVLSDWQFNDMIEKVGAIHRRRLKNYHAVLEAFKKAVENVAQ